VLADKHKTGGAELEALGWEKQFTRGEPRLSEMVELFESMGREVLLKPAETPDNYVNPDCEACFISCDSNQKIIWTRKL